MRLWPRRRWRDVAGELRDRDPAAGKREVSPEAQEGNAEKRERRLEAILAMDGEFPEDAQPPSGPRGPLVGRPLLVTGAAAVATVLVLLAFLPAEGDRDDGESLLRATAAVAAGQALPALAPTEFLYRRSTVWRVGVPGEVIFETREPRRRDPEPARPLPGSRPADAVPAGDEPTELVREIWLNERGGGAVEQSLKDGERRRTACSVGDLSLGAVGESRAGAFPGLPSCPPLGGTGKVRLLENAPGEPDGRRARRRELAALESFVRGVGPLTQRAPRLSELGGGVDELPTDPDLLRERLAAAARKEPDQLQLTFGAASGPEPAGGDVARFEVARDIIVNPLAAPEVRAEVFRWAEELPGLTVTEDVEDPLGREGAAISVSEEVRLPGFRKLGEDDLAASLGRESRIRREIVFDPESSDILATRVWLEETGNAALAPWLEEVGAPAEVEHEVFEPVSVAERPDLAAQPAECLDGRKGVLRDLRELETSREPGHPPRRRELVAEPVAAPICG